MRRLSVLSVAIACFSQASYAAITSHDALFTSVCIDAQVTGFDWQKGAWTDGMFFPNKYTLQKRDPATPDCVAALKATPAPDALFGNVATGCYTITDFGNGPGPALACPEVWDTATDGSETLVNVTCAAPGTFEWIIFNPTGNFQYARLGGDLGDNPKDDTKDPITVSVGTCKPGRPAGLYPPG